ncbi:class I mannose-6-phosphate isomerase [Rhizorhabdus phycosphaerae]|uniref:class I mannose-6-phosphate isomerase n=1 Tax=Rhizorhabdus phycosphaerae TaxID=2711156 RepID=UPI0013EA065C|nr:class I mannose-6-phosphate isomerase [Rhizorhabdus phycosphaerae]
MAATFLTHHAVEKPWGRRDLAPLFPDAAPDEPAIGEIWYDDPRGGAHDLLIKYLFTSERLSVQVHPDDDAARDRGFARGKDEAWIILSAEPDSTIALGFREPHDAAAVRAAALDGSIEHMLHWQPVQAGDVIYSPAGTVHAIGKGLRVVEVQQNLDLTYRFYDYGSARELHLDDAMAVSDFTPFAGKTIARPIGDGREIMAEGGKFVLERWSSAGLQDVDPGTLPLWLLPVAGTLEVDGRAAGLGDAILVEGPSRVTLSPDSTVYAAYPGADVLGNLLGSIARSTSDSSCAVTG